MKKLLSLYIILLCVSCGTEPKKEKFSYDRVKEEPKEVVDSNTIILNSNDQMLLIHNKNGNSFVTQFMKYFSEI